MVKMADRMVNVRLLERQASCVGECAKGRIPTQRQKKLLKGVRQLLHTILEDLRLGGECILERPRTYRKAP